MNRLATLVAGFATLGAFSLSTPAQAQIPDPEQIGREAGKVGEKYDECVVEGGAGAAIGGAASGGNPTGAATGAAVAGTNCAIREKTGKSGFNHASDAAGKAEQEVKEELRKLPF